MEKGSNNNTTKLSKMLRRALSIGHSAAPFSPVRDLRHHRTTSTVVNRGFFFSSPITPLFPTAAARARRRNKNDVVCAEPTSPKVSCIGQIKLAKSKCPENKNRAQSKNLNTKSSSLIKEENKGSFSKLKRLFSMGKNPSRKFNSTAFAATAAEHPVATVEAVAAPSLGKMKKFASSREVLGGFDWEVEMKREESRLSDHRRRYSTDDEDEKIPCSGSLPLNHSEGLTFCPKPKNEVNLWKRRTMDRPKPLQIT